MGLSGGGFGRIAVALMAGASLAACATVPSEAPVVQTAVAPTPAERLDALFKADALREDAVQPLDLLYRGEAVDPAVFGLIFTDELNRQQRDVAQQALNELALIDRASLDPTRQMSYDLFAWEKKEVLADLTPEILALTDPRPFDHFNGLHKEFPTLMSGESTAPFKTLEDYRRNLAVNRAFVKVIDTGIARFREGMPTGIVESKLTVRNMIAQLDALLAMPQGELPFLTPVQKFPESVPADRQGELRAAYVALANDELLPAYKRLRDFLANEYLPVAREQVGISAMTGGETMYRRRIAAKTTLSMEADEIHSIGLAEVKRIREGMAGVQRELKVPGDLKAMFEFIRTTPRNKFKSRQAMTDAFRAVEATVAGKVDSYFNSKPKTPLQILPYPEFREKYEAGGSYYEGSDDGSRPGIFYFNAYDLPSRSLAGTATLYLHEGIPGHHYQIMLALENTALPEFQRRGGNTAFVEGWALYAETLGYPMGLYDDPWQRWGTLDDEMLRAMRLVVDTGLHAKGWTREQAIAYMLDNSGMSRTDATSEVERYIANPGQALAYKLGSLTIQKLRGEAEAALGARFDIRAFHDQVLDSGALPLPILEAKIRRWIAAGG